MSTGKADPAFTPEWVRDEAGNLVPPLTGTAAEQKRVENERISREQAQIKQGFASQPTAGHSKERDAELDRGR